jgi:hypothetical protein
MSTELRESCHICFTIRCKQCGWEATEEDVVRIQRGEMRACPVCGWRPGEAVKSL